MPTLNKTPTKTGGISKYALFDHWKSGTHTHTQHTLRTLISSFQQSRQT